VIIVALFAISWSPAGDPPQAPPPHVKKTTAELLVGTWQLTQIDKRRPSETATIEFTQDGKVVTRVVGPTIPTQKRTGTYTLHQNSLRLAIEATTDEPGENEDLMIESLTETELLLHDSVRRQKLVCKRAQGK
jgi:uncharacterized protein (TIGR03066 family)